MTPLAATLADLHEAVCRHPEDTDRRLVYADALDDAGQGERAEFIRVQCELGDDKPCWMGEGSFETPYGKVECLCGTHALRRRERELFAALAGRLDVVLYAGAAFEWHYRPRPEELRRGFVTGVTLGLADWCGHGPALCRAAPITGVRLTDKRPYRGPVQPGKFCWRRNGGAAEQHALPVPLWDALAGEGAGPLRVLKWYDSQESALDALSRACVARARKLAWG